MEDIRRTVNKRRNYIDRKLIDSLDNISTDILHKYRYVVAWWYFLFEGDTMFLDMYLNTAREYHATPTSVFLIDDSDRWCDFSEITNTVTIRYLNRITDYIDYVLEKRGE